MKVIASCDSLLERNGQRDYLFVPAEIKLVRARSALYSICPLCGVFQINFSILYPLQILWELNVLFQAFPYELNVNTSLSMQMQHTKNLNLERFKDVRANCFCASLLRTQIHTPRHTRARALSNKMRDDRAKGHCYSFAWI